MPPSRSCRDRVALVAAFFRDGTDKGHLGGLRVADEEAVGSLARLSGRMETNHAAGDLVIGDHPHSGSHPRVDAALELVESDAQSRDVLAGARQQIGRRNQTLLRLTQAAV